MHGLALSGQEQAALRSPWPLGNRERSRVVKASSAPGGNSPRNKPAPSLPEIPDYKKNKPSIYGLRVEESDETFEITISTEHQVRESFRYELEHNVLKVYFEEAKTQTTPTGLVIRVKKHEFLITLPAMVLRDSANHRLEGDTFHIYLHKG